VKDLQKSNQIFFHERYNQSHPDYSMGLVCANNVYWTFVSIYRLDMYIYKEYQRHGGKKVDDLFCKLVREKYAEMEYDVPKFLLFIEKSLEEGYDVWLYDSQSTASKYVTVKSRNKTYKVRFSNHKPNKFREQRGDCDFFVGRNNYSISTTKDAWESMQKYFLHNP